MEEIVRPPPNSSLLLTKTTLDEHTSEDVIIKPLWFSLGYTASSQLESGKSQYDEDEGNVVKIDAPETTNVVITTDKKDLLLDSDGEKPNHDEEEEVCHGTTVEGVGKAVSEETKRYEVALTDPLLGQFVCGVVQAVGERIQGIAVGSMMAGCLSASYVILENSTLIRLPYTSLVPFFPDPQGPTTLASIGAAWKPLCDALQCQLDLCASSCARCLLVTLSEEDLFNLLGPETLDVFVSVQANTNIFEHRTASSLRSCLRPW
eukprot:GHVS01064649.1.p1 GENE.GHVS01064649.1~~GHVS01064649.1.p1  ORF type:complete len:262 (-),score=38.16 GHVS01064649.1:922-1707(-)